MSYTPVDSTDIEKGDASPGYIDALIKKAAADAEVHKIEAQKKETSVQTEQKKQSGGADCSESNSSVDQTTQTRTAAGSSSSSDTTVAQVYGEGASQIISESLGLGSVAQGLKTLLDLKNNSDPAAGTDYKKAPLGTKQPATTFEALGKKQKELDFGNGKSGASLSERFQISRQSIGSPLKGCSAKSHTMQAVPAVRHSLAMTHTVTQNLEAVQAMQALKDLKAQQGAALGLHGPGGGHTRQQLTHNKLADGPPPPKFRDPETDTESMAG